MATGTDRHAAARDYRRRYGEEIDHCRDLFSQGQIASHLVTASLPVGVAIADLIEDVDRLTDQVRVLTAERDDWRHRAVSERVTVNSLDAAIREHITNGEAKARERDAAVAQADVAASAVRQTAEWWAAEYRLLAERCSAAEGGATELPETWRRIADLEAREAAAVARAERAESALHDCQMSLAQSETLNLGHEGYIAGLEKRLAELRQYLAGSWRRVGAFGVTYCTYCNANGGRHRKDCPAASPAEKE